MAPRNRKLHYGIVLICTIVIIAALGTAIIFGCYRAEFAGASFLSPLFQKLHKFGEYLIGLSILLTSFVLVFLFVNHKFYKGLSYGIHHIVMSTKVQRGIRESGYYIPTFALGREVAVVPSVSITFDDTLCTLGTFTVSTHTKYDKKLADAPISPSLPKQYVILNHWKDDSEHFYIYEFGDWSISNAKFSSLRAFRRHYGRLGNYTIAVGSKSKHQFEIHHILIVGQTGMGKSYIIYLIILQIIIKKCKWDLFIADPKSSGLLALGNMINPDNAASSTDEIIELLRKLNVRFEARKKEFYRFVKDNIDSSYSDYNLSPIILIIDEFAAFQSSLKRKKKEIRDEVDDIIGNIIREGRQVGVFIIMGLQQANASNYATEYREQMPIMIILGSSGRQTYMTALGVIPDNANRKFSAGQGLLVAPNIATADHPDIIAVPTIGFEIGKAVRDIVGRDEVPDGVNDE